jgi:glutaredoxin 3
MEYISPVARSDDASPTPAPLGTAANPEVIVWSKDHCGFCQRAKRLLDENNIAYQERNISTGNWTREQLIEAVPTARTLPQIVFNGTLIGGHRELLQFFANGGRTTL